MSFQHQNRRQNKMPRNISGRRRGGGSRGNKRFIFQAIIAAIIAISAWITKTQTSGKDNSIHETKGEFQVYTNAKLIDHKYNDGDSFFVQHGGNQVQYRLYYVDCPESRDKPYDDHRQRVTEQGQDLGGLSYKQTIKRGQEAKDFTKKILKKGNFDVYTKEESVFGSERQYAFILLNRKGENTWLHELLIQKGLARVHTKGITTPEEVSFKQHRAYLEKLQKSALLKE